MAGRVALRSITRRFSSSGKILSEEEKAAENVYIKKMEREKLEKVARQGLKTEATAAPGSGSGVPPVSDAEASSSKVSSNKYRNYAIVAGALTVLGAAGWYLKSGSKKTEEVHE